MAKKAEEKSEEEFVEGVLNDLPEELRKKLRKKCKKAQERGSAVEEWVGAQREEIAERERIKPLA